jgi:hypothetical protein
MKIYYSVHYQYEVKVLKTPGLMSTLTTTCGNNTLRGGRSSLLSGHSL